MANQYFDNLSIKGVKTIVPHDTNKIDANWGDALMFKSIGDISVVFKDETEAILTIPTEVLNKVYDIEPYIIKATGTTIVAGDILGIKLKR